MREWSIFSRSRTNNASISVAAALEIGRSYVLDGTVALDLARDTLRRRARIGILVRLVESVCFVADGGVVDIAVTRNGGCESESSSDVLHCDSIGRCTILRMKNW